MWKVGDRVVIIQDARRNLESFVGFKGTVNFASRDEISVVFDKYVNGHDLLGDCKKVMDGFCPQTERTKTKPKQME